MLTKAGNIIHCIATISPAQRSLIITLDHMQIITMWTLSKVGTMCKILCTYYAGIMLDAFLYLCIVLKNMTA